MGLQIDCGVEHAEREKASGSAGNSSWACAGAVVLAPAIGVLDYASGREISFSIFYLGPVALAAWRCGLVFSVFICVLSAVCWYLADWAAGAVYWNQLVPAWNGFVRFGIFLVTAILLSKVRRSSDELQAAVAQGTADLRAQIEQKKLLEQRLTQLGVEERARISRDLHDDLGQFLAGLALLAKSVADEHRDCHGKQDPARLVELLGRAAQKTRRLDRMLRPTALETGGLTGGLSALVQETRELFGIQCNLELPEEAVDLDETRSLLFYRIAQEAIGNAIRHGGARELSVRLELRAGNSMGETPAARTLLLVVEDKGQGFAPGIGVDRGNGLGIMQHRAEMINGQLRIISAPGQGCRVECLVLLPCAASN
jgi:signal transduction histidine kinase